jgi:hypothetical protein
MSKFWEAFAVYKGLGQNELLRDTEWARFPQNEQEGTGWEWVSRSSTGIKIQVVGVWDTVGSLGIPDNQWWGSNQDAKHQFHDTRLNPPCWTSTIKNAFHALGLDEHRAPFTPTLWVLPSDSERAAETTLIQCWFPGVHINIGGGDEDVLNARQGDLESIANATFVWMLDRCAPFLAFDYVRLTELMWGYVHAAAEIAGKHPQNNDTGWATTGKIIDSFTMMYKTLCSRFRTPGAYFQNYEARERVTNECVHPMV